MAFIDLVSKEYVEPIENDVTDIKTADYGAGVNLLEISADSQTVNDITFTVDKTAGTVTVNGTASADAVFNITKDVYPLPKGEYILSGIPNTGSWNTFCLAYGAYACYDATNGIKFTLEEAACAYIRVAHGVTVSNLVFKPMIRNAIIKDNTFYPYIKTNQQLQEDVAKLRPITLGTMYDADNVAAVHNANPRGKDITDIFNAGELSGMISSGLFDEIYPGDYFNLPMAAVTDRWSARTFTCRVMHLNPMKYVGDGTLNITDNHIGFATDESWFNCAWNESGTTAGGYVSSTIHTRINESAIITAWQNALSGKLTLMQARMLLSSAVNTEVDSAEYPGQKGMASNWDWNTNYFKLMSEMERYGAPVWSSGKGFNTGSSNFQLAYYANNAALRGNKRRTWDWLSDIVSVSRATTGNGHGHANCYAVTGANHVRPLGFLKS